jgi:hypothetical protein
MLARITRGRSATLTHTFYSDGTATNPSPDTATVTITNDAGTAVVTDGATTDTGTGTVSYTVTPTQTANLDIWRVAWTATFGGQPQVFTDVVEIAGGVLFTIAQARAVRPMNDATAYPTSAIVDTRTLVEQALEDACGIAFVPRYKRERLDGEGLTMLLASQPRVTAIRAVELDGAAVSVADLATIDGSVSGRLYYPNGWVTGVGNYSVAYEHGYDQPPLRVTQAALLLAKNWLVKGPIDDRTTGFSTEDGTFSLSTPGMRGASFGIPEVDAVVGEYNLRAGIA